MQSCASAAKLRAAGPFYQSASSARFEYGFPPPRIVNSAVVLKAARAPKMVQSGMLVPVSSFQDAGRKTTPSNSSSGLVCEPARRSWSCACQYGCQRSERGTIMRARSLSETSESARRVGSYRGGPLRFRLARALVRADARRSHPASRLGRRSVPPPARSLPPHATQACPKSGRGCCSTASTVHLPGP